VKPPSAARQGERRYALKRDGCGAEKFGCSYENYGAETMAWLP